MRLKSLVAKLDKERIHAVLGTPVEEQRRIEFILRDVRDAIEEIADDDDDGGLDPLLERNFTDESDSSSDDPDGRGDEDSDNDLTGSLTGTVDETRSTSFRHFVGITEIQANLLIGILNTSRAIQQESLDLWQNVMVGGERISSIGEQGERVVEVNNIFNGDISLSDSEKISTIAERLANETVSQMRAAGIRV